MKSLAELDAFNARIRRRYVIKITHDLRKHRFRAWSATMTHGIMQIGWPVSSVWRARSRERLIVRCERWARGDALRQGIENPEIRIEEKA